MPAIAFTSKSDAFTLLRDKIGGWLDDVNTSIDTVDVPPQYATPASVHIDNASTIPDFKADDDDWIRSTLPRLESVADLSNNWDDEGSPGTDLEIVATAVALLDRLKGSSLGPIPVPFVCPISGGGFQFEWTSKQKHLELEFFDNTTIVFLRQERAEHETTTVTGEYPVTNLEKTHQYLDWFAAV